MDCEQCRTSLSARLDGEHEVDRPAEVDAHLEQCAPCRAWQAEATALTRALRVRPANPTPDLVDAVLERVPTRDRKRLVLRVALGVVAAAQLALGVFQTTIGFSSHWHAEHTAMTSHLFNESTAWNLAIGIGLVWVAIRERAASGMLPLLSVFLVALVAFSVHDLTTGAVSAGRVASHALLALGLGLLYAVHRQYDPGQDPRPGNAAGTDASSGHSVGGAGGSSTPARGRRKNGRSHLRPAGRRAA